MLTAHRSLLRASGVPMPRLPSGEHIMLTHTNSSPSLHEDGRGGIVGLADGVDHIEVVADLALAEKQPGTVLLATVSVPLHLGAPIWPGARIEVGDGGLGS